MDEIFAQIYPCADALGGRSKIEDRHQTAEIRGQGSDRTNSCDS
jgi:hypothetical protein